MNTRLLILGLSLILAACGDDGGDVRPDAEPVGSDPDAEREPDAELGAPAVTITWPSQGERIVGARTITVTGTITGDAGIAAVTVTVDGGTPVTATHDDATFSVEVPLVDGGQDIVVEVTDDFDRTATDDVTVTYPFVALTTFQDATLALGQPDLVTNTNPTIGPSAVFQPYGHGVWVGDRLYVPSSGFNRISGWDGFPSRNGEPADFALGQADLATSTAGTGATGMDFPQTIDATNGKLFVLDWSNHRLMAWNTTPATTGVAADYAVGQPDLVTIDTGCTQDNHGNYDDFFVGGGKLFVSDSTNHRVLIWNTIPTASGVAPDLVLGQIDFTHCAINDDNGDGVADATPTARTMNDPIGIWSDGTALFVADSDNGRVLVWNTIPTTSFTPADWVLGSPDATTGTGGTAADRLDRPVGVTGNGNQLAIADTGNDRVLMWSPIPTANVAAQVVLGQGVFTLGAPNDDDQNGTPDASCTARTLNYPTGVRFVRDTLMVSDGDNHRIVFYGPLPCPAGQYEPPGMTGTCADDPCQPDPCTAGEVCRNDTGVGVCE